MDYSILEEISCKLNELDDLHSDLGKIINILEEQKPRRCTGGRAYQRKYKVLDCGHAHQTIEAYNFCIWRSRKSDR